MVKNNKKVLYTIIVFLLINLIIGTVGLVGKKMDFLHEKVTDPNPNHEFLKNGKLYFYNNKDELLGTYDCKNTVYCGYAYEYDDNGGYNLKNYYDGKIDLVKLYNNRYAFIVDTDLKEKYYRSSDIYLYDVKKREVLNTFTGVKDYTLTFNEDIVFVQDKKTSLFQIVDLSGNEPVYNTEPIYKYLGINNLLVDNKLDSNNIAAYDGKRWYIINSKGEAKSKVFDRDLIDYNGKYAILGNMNGYSIVTYQNVPVLNGNTFAALRFVGRYVALYDNQAFYIVDYEKNSVVSKKYPISAETTYYEKLNKKDEVEIYINNELVETVK